MQTLGLIVATVIFFGVSLATLVLYENVRIKAGLAQFLRQALPHKAVT